MMYRLTQNEMICDGTPRSERGWRAYVDGPWQYSGKWPTRTVYRSPLFARREDAEAWALAKIEETHHAAA